jgi:hypothetical protein
MIGLNTSPDTIGSQSEQGGEFELLGVGSSIPVISSRIAILSELLSFGLTVLGFASGDLL